MKRFTETDKWTKDTWFSELEPRYKLFWLYLIDTCDNVGVWEVNKRMANFLIGHEYSMEDVLKAFGDKIVAFDDGRKWWVRSFIDFQHGVLDESSCSKPIQSYIALLKNHGLWKPYTKGIDTLQGKGKGKGKGEGKAKARAYSEDFETWWKENGKGSKPNAFKRWEEKRKSGELPELERLMEISMQYKAHCKANDRSLKDSEGWINGKFWETEWVVGNTSTGTDAFIAKLAYDYGADSGATPDQVKRHAKNLGWNGEEY